MIFTTKYPYEISRKVYETDNFKASYYGENGYAGSDIGDLLLGKYKDKKGYVQLPDSPNNGIMIEFKNNKITPHAFHMAFNNSSGINIGIDYLINDTWEEVMIADNNGIDVGMYEELVVELPKILTSGIRFRANFKVYVTELWIDFDLSSPMIKNNVKNIVMQNEFFKQIVGLEVD